MMSPLYLYIQWKIYLFNYFYKILRASRASRAEQDIFLLVARRAEQILPGSFRRTSELENFWLVAHERKEGSARSTARNARLARHALLVANLDLHYGRIAPFLVMGQINGI